MKMGALSLFLRWFGLIRLADYLRYHYFKFKNRTKNREFLIHNPDIKLPPDYLMYESFQIDYDEYFTKSRETAKWLLGHFQDYISINRIRILDWGCGPGRIIRHMPELLDDKSEIFGTDYNEKSTEWCKTNLPEIDFRTNGLSASLEYDNNYFNVIYGISIFTHLS